MSANDNQQAESQNTTSGDLVAPTETRRCQDDHFCRSCDPIRYRAFFEEARTELQKLQEEDGLLDTQGDDEDNSDEGSEDEDDDNEDYSSSIIADNEDEDEDDNDNDDEDDSDDDDDEDEESDHDMDGGDDGEVIHGCIIEKWIEDVENKRNS